MNVFSTVKFICQVHTYLPCRHITAVSSQPSEYICVLYCHNAFLRHDI